jgi:hypothetical protein
MHTLSAGRPCTPDFGIAQAGRQCRQASQDSSVALLPQQKNKNNLTLSLVTPLVGILHLTLCSVTSHACRPRL